MAQKLDVFVLSDGVGETALRVARAAFAQFPEMDTTYTKYPFIKKDNQLQSILEAAKDKNAVARNVTDDIFSIIIGNSEIRCAFYHHICKRNRRAVFR